MNTLRELDNRGRFQSSVLKVFNDAQHCLENLKRKFECCIFAGDSQVKRLSPDPHGERIIFSVLFLISCFCLSFFLQSGVFPVKSGRIYRLWWWRCRGSCVLIGGWLLSQEQSGFMVLSSAFGRFTEFPSCGRSNRPNDICYILTFLQLKYVVKLRFNTLESGPTYLHQNDLEDVFRSFFFTDWLLWDHITRGVDFGFLLYCNQHVLFMCSCWNREDRYVWMTGKRVWALP